MTQQEIAPDRTDCDAAAIASVLGALASHWRIRIVWLLAEETELDVGELAERLDQPLANVSAHLRRLREAGLVTSQRTGTHIGNRLTDGAATALCNYACQIQPATQRR